jgi:L-aspartate oxidase
MKNSVYGNISYLKTEENPLFLISEAVRGEGARLVTEKGDQFMSKYHPRADLAPRDVVTRPIVAEQKKGHQVYLDASFLKGHFKERFPNIYGKSHSIGIDPGEDWIPVTPAAHFFMGGIQTDSFGRTNIQGLYACGECANTGVHGANRLVSNSLLEGLVFGYRVAQAMWKVLPRSLLINRVSLTNPVIAHTVKPLNLEDQRVRMLQELMWSKLGIIREEVGMTKAYHELCELESQIESSEGELLNMLLVARLITSSALQLKESCFY